VSEQAALQGLEAKMAVDNRDAGMRAFFDRLASVGKEEILTISTRDALRMPEAVFRHTFIAIVEELVGDMARRGSHADAMAFIKEGRSPHELSTKEMREIVLANQYWFNPKPQPNGN
jgi:hypothetical protein